VTIAHLGPPHIANTTSCGNRGSGNLIHVNLEPLYRYPNLDPKTRTLRVSLVFPNPDRLLKPNMFAEVVIHGGPGKNVLKIPSEALIVTGERESVVLALGEGQFRPVDVALRRRDRR